ncbi:hypothetical protein Ahy_B06g084610 [Arachis hypogaea]|uniref:Aminotransferase-like plant mobile domain-containing protein n=1 Tax=Arachis hypogaea TaxID=3818 RepID=A0A444YSD0_ARAHY|nr:hypothetical protein Ahy_B06g084610 [Arachis hypogaea]
MPFGECTVTLQDVAYQLGLPIDGEAVSGCLTDFKNLMENGRPAWEWFRELFGEISPPNKVKQMMVHFTWFHERFRVLPTDASEETMSTNNKNQNHESVPSSSSSPSTVQKWGTHIMGKPAVPSSHPNNKKAAVEGAPSDEEPGVHYYHQQHPYVQHSPLEKPPSRSPMESIVRNKSQMRGSATEFNGQIDELITSDGGLARDSGHVEAHTKIRGAKEEKTHY